MQLEPSTQQGSKEPLKRWNRTDDKNLFRIIREISREDHVSLDEVIESITTNEGSAYWSRIMLRLKNQGKYLLPTPSYHSSDSEIYLDTRKLLRQ